MDDKQRAAAHVEPLTKAPQDYPRRLLLAVAGLTPQILTETLYALAVQRKPSFVPTEVRLITTEEGAQRAQLSLLHPDAGHFQRLCADYGLADITFGAEQIHVLEGDRGKPLQDIRSPEDNTRAADAITEIVRGLTQDEEAALHVSIAGGRKTMGFYLGYALSLYGRQQDRLSHVLVNAPYEAHRDFYYPTPRSSLIHDDKRRRHYDAKDAEVTLAEIPFVCLRDGLDRALMDGRASFSAAVRAAQRAQRALPPQILELHPANCMVCAGGESFSMPPSHFALYWMLADRARLGQPGFHWRDGADKVLEYRKRLVGDFSGSYERAEELLKGRFRPENFNPMKSHIKRCLEQQLGKRRAEPYLITRLEPIPKTRYNRFGLKLPPDAITIVQQGDGGGNLAGTTSGADSSNDGG